MPNWKKVITSGSAAVLSDLTLSGVAQPEIKFNGTSDAGVDFAIRATPEGLDFYEPEDSNKIHMQIIDDGGVDAKFGLKIGGTSVLSSGRALSNVTGNISMFTNNSGYTTNTGTTTAGNSQTFTNKSGNISQWANDSGYITSFTDTVDMGSGFIVANSGGTSQFTIVEDNALRFAGSGATSVAFNSTTKKVTISSTNTTYSVGDGGLTQNNFTSTLKTKLDGIASSANNYSLPLSAAGTRGGVKIGYSENGKNYPVELSSEKMYVNVPWSDNNTTYSTNTAYGTSISGTQIRLNGGEIASGVDLDTMRTQGVFSQNSNSDAVAGSNYPEDKAGVLTVDDDMYGNGYHTHQMYAIYNSQNIYSRSYYNGSWTSWRNLAQDTNTTYSVGDGGLTQKNFTTTLKTKLDGIAASANNYSWTLAGTDIDNGDEITLSGGLSFSSGVLSQTDNNTTYSVGDGGLTQKNFTSTLKTKLDGIATGATNTSAPYYTSAIAVGDGGLTQKNFTSTLKTKLDGIATGATANTGTMSSWIIKEGNGTESTTVTNGETVTIEDGTGIESELTSTSSGGTITITNTAPAGTTHLNSNTTKSDVGLSNVANESRATILGGNLTGTINSVAVATVTAGAALGATSNQDSTSTIQSGTTKSNVGLSNVTNESKATMFSSAALTGNPTAPTQAANNNSTRIATTAYVQTEISDLIGGAPGALDTLNELAAAIGDDASYASSITTALGGKLSTSGKAADSELLDGVNSTSFLRSDADDSFSGGLVSTARDEGIFGIYDSYKTDHIWSMGTSYKNHASGTNFGSLYGLAYKHTNNTTGGTMAGGHQMVWCTNGNPQSAMGTNIWTGGTVTATGGNSTNWNTAYGWGNHASAGYNTIIGTDTDIDTSGATIIDNLYMTDGVITSHGTRNLTLANLGYTGATNANNYIHPTYNGDDFSVDTGALTGATIVSDIDINVTTDGNGHVTDANGSVSTRTLTLANLGYTGATNANNYVLPTNLAGDDINVDTGALTGATVISDLDFNITTNTSGLVTDANGTVSTRTLTLADLGYTGATNANNYIHPTYNGDDFSVDTGALTGATVVSDIDINVTTDGNGHVTDANGSVSTRTLTLANLGYTGETNATADQTASEILTLIKTVDGGGSGLDADLLDGLQLHTGRNDVANRVVRTQGSGYAEFGWINTTSGNTTSTITDIYVNTNDGYIRKATKAEFQSQMGIQNTISNTDVDTGTEVVTSAPLSSYSGYFFDYVVSNDDNFRAGTVTAVEYNGTVEFTETSTADIGDTSDLVLSCDAGNGSDMKLMATAASDNWSVKVKMRLI